MLEPGATNDSELARWFRLLDEQPPIRPDAYADAQVRIDRVIEQALLSSGIRLVRRVVQDAQHHTEASLPDGSLSILFSCWGDIATFGPVRDSGPTLEPSRRVALVEACVDEGFVVVPHELIESMPYDGTQPFWSQVLENDSWYPRFFGWL